MAGPLPESQAKSILSLSGCDVNLIKQSLSILVLGAAVTGVIGCVVSVEENVPSVAEVRADVEEHLQAGASLEEIQAYLDDAGIEHRPRTVTNAGRYSELRDKLPPDTPIYTGIVKGSRQSAVIIVFVLDEGLRYKQLVLLESLPL
jgi:hypothetical protein